MCRIVKIVIAGLLEQIAAIHKQMERLVDGLAGTPCTLYNRTHYEQEKHPKNPKTRLH